MGVSISTRLRDIGDHSEARRSAQEALDLFRDLGNPDGISKSLSTLGEIELRLGKVDQAGARLAESLSISLRLGNRHAAAFCLEVLAGVHAAKGDAATSARLLGASDQLLGEIAVQRDSVDQALRERTLTGLSEWLSEEELAQALAAGRALSIEDAVALALREGS